jgi:hypothetical protein
MFEIRSVLGVMLEVGKGDSGSCSSSATLVVGDVGGGICGPYFSQSTSSTVLDLYKNVHTSVQDCCW